MVKLKDKRAWLRIVEATLSIILILGSVLIFYQSNKAESSDNLSSILPTLADQIAKNETLRYAIITSGSSNKLAIQGQINTFMSQSMKRTDLSHSSVICGLNETCSPSSAINSRDGNIFSYERIISADLYDINSNFTQNAKKIRLYLWKS